MRARTAAPAAAGAAMLKDLSLSAVIAGFVAVLALIVLSAPSVRTLGAAKSL